MANLKDLREPTQSTATPLTRRSCQVDLSSPMITALTKRFREGHRPPLRFWQPCCHGSTSKLSMTSASRSTAPGQATSSFNYSACSTDGGLTAGGSAAMAVGPKDARKIALESFMAYSVRLLDNPMPEL
jgi:hypothetical protein